MSVSREILRTYRAPRQVARRLFAAASADDRPETRALVYLLLGCFIVFVSQVPGLIDAGPETPDAAPVDARLGITFFVWMFVWPLFFYLLAALGHLVARVLGGQGSFARARLALFWTVLAVSPLMLFRGMVGALMGPGGQLMAADTLVALAFAAIWVISLSEAERRQPV